MSADVSPYLGMFHFKHTVHTDILYSTVPPFSVVHWNHLVNATVLYLTSSYHFSKYSL